MNEPARRQRNADRLQQLFPTFAARVAAVIAELEDEGWRPRIQDAWRSIASQEAAFAAGHSKLKFGFHNVTGTGGKKESLAVDMLDDNAPLKRSTEYLLRLAAAAQKHGLSTGVLWGLPAPLQKGVKEASAAKNFKAVVKVGWDPTHIEPTGITPAEAKAGKRPA